MPSSRKSPPSDRRFYKSTSPKIDKRSGREVQSVAKKATHRPDSARGAHKRESLQDTEQARIPPGARTRTPGRKNLSHRTSERKTSRASADGRSAGPKIVRLQRYLAECGVASRRGAEEVIHSGKVRVNDKVVIEPSYKIEIGRDRVRVGKRSVVPPPKGILLFHKPRGVVSTLEDPQSRPCVGDYITKHFRSYFPVGRLDYDSSGLMVLTNDGELAERLMHPRYGLDRVYEARVEGYVQPATLAKAARGVTLDDGRASANITIDEPGAKSTWIRVRVAEGRNRLVRRLMQRLGHPVEKLRRLSHGPFALGKLRPGDMRRLTEKEYESARNRVINFSHAHSAGGREGEEFQGRGRPTRDRSRRNGEDSGSGRSMSGQGKRSGKQPFQQEDGDRAIGGRDRSHGNGNVQARSKSHSAKSDQTRRKPRSSGSKRWRGA